MPLVSIVIPAFNAGRFISRALKGIAAQTHKEWEVIVVEDGSHDETKAVTREFAAGIAQCVRYENNGSNLGVSATRNRAMALATGDIIAFLDADDHWTAEHLEKGLETLAQGAGICFSGFYIFDEATQKTLESSLPDVSGMKYPLERLFQSNFIQTSSLVMARRDPAEKAGGFDTDLKVGEDCDYWMRIISQGARLACTNKLTCYYSKHESSAMAKTLMVAEHSVRFCRKHMENAHLPLSLRKGSYANALCNHGRLARKQDPALARSLFLEAWKTRPLNLRYLAYAAGACMQS